jgi:hypothetical protein
MDAYNAGELDSDGFEGAYTALESTEGYNGPCIDVSSNSAAFTLSADADG